MLQIESRAPTSVCTCKSHLDMAARPPAGFRFSVAVYSDIARRPSSSPIMGVPFKMRIMIAAMPLLDGSAPQKFGSKFGLLLIGANEVHGDMYLADHEALLRDRIKTLEGFNIRLVQGYTGAV